MIRSRVTMIIALISLILTGCNCSGCSIQPNIMQPHKVTRHGDAPFTTRYQQADKAEQDLIAYISKRTVRVVGYCKVVNTQTAEVIKPYKEMTWGTGAILLSTDNYSLVQTAAHVVTHESQTVGDRKLICDKFKLEKRDRHNKIERIYEGVGLLAKDDQVDVALLRVPYNMGVSSRLAEDVYLGQKVRFLGYPYLRGNKGSHLSYSYGYVATINIPVKKSLRKVPHLTRFAAFGYMGNSGGAVWTTDGKIVGSVTLLTGWRTFGGGFIPQQDCVYGPSVKAFKKFYKEHNIRGVI